MKLIVGLGNPGKKYVGTRHNVGFMVVEKLAGDRRWNESKKGELLYSWIEANRKRLELIKPTTFMNRSGFSLAYAKRKHPGLKLADIYVVHDDLDIPLGKYKIQRSHGPRQHNGLQSIYEQLGSKEFWHVKVGIENRFREARSTKFEARNNDQISNIQNSKQTSKTRIPGEEYVLQRFSDEEREVVDRAVKKVIKDLHQRLYKI